jgi:4-alpha-glucanotransferase
MGKEQKTIGTLAPIFSLTSSQQSPEDQGTFETGLYFLDWLKKTNQNAWQILPFNETQLEKGSATKHVPSPYKGYGVGLAPKYLASTYKKLKPSPQEKNAFIAQHKDWLEDYVLFCTIRDVYGTDDWRQWDPSLQHRNKDVLQEWAKKHKQQLDYYIVQQWQLQQSYDQLHEKAKDLGICLIGDIPYYLSVQSPLVWAHQKAFLMQKDGTLPFVSGIPNTTGAYFGRQIWGHPLYNWEYKDEVMYLWEIRLKYQSMLFENVRFDHAKAFFKYGVLEPNHEANDRYEDGPGSDVFKKIIGLCHQNNLSVYAEDSGDVTDGLRACLRELQIPGIKIYHFAVKTGEEEVNKKYAEIGAYPKNCVAYTTTHDTETLVSYLKHLTSDQKQKLATVGEIAYDADDKKFAITIRDAIVQSPAEMVIIPIQDWLLATERINIPGTEEEVDDPNWRFKIDKPIEDLPLNL